MEWHTISRLSAHMGETAEGYLVCRDVPIARTGTQIYWEAEVPPLQGDAGGRVHVEREAEEVFAPDSIRSYEGKPLVDDHPFEAVGPDNWSDLTIGYVANVRRGEGIHDELLLGDLIFTTRRGIERVKRGKRALSVGYNATYEQDAPGLGRQRNIFCNHVALVDEGRCGARCTIMDGRAVYDYDGTDDAGPTLADLEQIQYAAECSASDAAEPTHDAACACDACNPRKEKTIMAGLRELFGRAFVARDKTALEAIINEAAKGGSLTTDNDPEHGEPDGDEGKQAIVIHNHHNEGGDKGDDDQTKDADKDDDEWKKKTDDALKALTDGLTAIRDMLTARGAGKDAEGDKDDDKDKDDTKDQELNMGEQAATASPPASAEPDLMEADPALKTGPSMMGDATYTARVNGAMNNIIRDTKARAEVLNPGMKIGVLDGALGPDRLTQAGQRICDTRRAALVAAAGNERGMIAIGRHTGDAIKTMSCDAVRMLFIDASDRMRAMNNAANRPSPQFGEMRRATNDSMRAKIDAINARNAEFWAANGGVGKRVG
jgi:hypothetical protein